MTTALHGRQSLVEKTSEAILSGVDNIGLYPKAVLNFQVDVIIIRGKIKGTDNWARLRYVGRGTKLSYLKGNLAYLKTKLLADAEIVSTKTTSVFSYRSVLAETDGEADVTFVDFGAPYEAPFKKSGAYLQMPDWINMILPLDRDWDEIEQGFNKTTRKMIRRNTFTSEVSHDPEVIDAFYDDFYLPYLRHRHEDGFEETKNTVRRRAQQGGILRVMGDDGPVVAGVIYPEGGVLHYLWLGMPERYLHNQPDGALFASYYFCLRYAHENGFKAANWMGTRAFATDGVYQFKRKWGVHIEDSFSPYSIFFQPAQNNENAVKFAETFPVIARRNGGLEQIFCTTAAELKETDINRMIAGFCCEGLDQITIVHVREAGTPTTIAPSSAQENVRVITTDVAGFAACYQRDFDASKLSVAVAS